MTQPILRRRIADGSEVNSMDGVYYDADGNLIGIEESEVRSDQETDVGCTEYGADCDRDSEQS